MKSQVQLVLGIFLALLSSIVVIGSGVAALVENGRYNPALSLANQTLPSTIYGQSQLILTQPANALESQPSLIVSAFFGQFNTDPDCVPRNDWMGITIQPDDTLISLAIRYGIPPELLAEGNCLILDTLLAGTTLFVPVLPTEQQEAGQVSQADNKPARRCGAPPGWVSYFVRPGDTLFALSYSMGISVAQLQNANCMGSSNILRIGQVLYVPFIPLPIHTTAPVPSATTPSETTVPPVPTETTPVPTETTPPPTETTPATTEPPPPPPTETTPAPTEPSPPPTETTPAPTEPSPPPPTETTPPPTEPPPVSPRELSLKVWLPGMVAL